ncbi:MAG TPA: methyltransferase domain-containing protein [Capillimicrobium sp.]|jgi:SAM-dependent methyltransferase
MTAVADLKQTHRATWAAGDYAAVAECIDDAPPADLLAHVPVAPGERVLDVAAGTGNVAVKAALAGARVTGLDLTPELLTTAARRAERAGVQVEWVEGDAEALPFEDGAFDAVLSVFGVQFAPRHQHAADELARVCRPGGRIGLVNWTPDGHIGQLFRLLGRYLPAPPDFASPPPLWGDPEHVRALLDGAGIEWTFSRGHNPWRFASAEEWTAFMETNYGPTLKARQRLTAEGTWDECRAEIVALAERFNEARDGSLLIRAEYLVAAGRRTA